MFKKGSGGIGVPTPAQISSGPHLRASKINITDFKCKKQTLCYICLKLSVTMRLLCTVECPHDTSTVRACADLRTPPRASMHPMHPHASPADFTVQTLLYPRH